MANIPEEVERLPEMVTAEEFEEFLTVPPYDYGTQLFFAYGLS